MTKEGKVCKERRIGANEKEIKECFAEIKCKIIKSVLREIDALQKIIKRRAFRTR